MTKAMSTLIKLEELGQLLLSIVLFNRVQVVGLSNSYPIARSIDDRVRDMLAAKAMKETV